MWHGQGDLLADLGGTQLQAQIPQLTLQAGDPSIGILRLLPRPASRARLQAAHGGLQQLPAQLMEAALADVQGQRGLCNRAPARQRLQEHPQPGLGLVRAIEPPDQARSFDLPSSCHGLTLGKGKKPGRATAVLPGVPFSSVTGAARAGRRSRSRRRFGARLVGGRRSA
jgi:hypothetical protein